MGWTSGTLDVPFSARAAIKLALGAEFAGRVIDTARFGSVIYAAVRSPKEPDQVSGLVLLTERQGGEIWTKPVPEEMGPTEDACPARILDLLTETSDDRARAWRESCRARIESAYPKAGQKVAFDNPISFDDGTEHRVLIYVGRARFRSLEGAIYSLPDWKSRDYQLRAPASEGAS